MVNYKDQYRILSLASWRNPNSFEKAVGVIFPRICVLVKYQFLSVFLILKSIQNSLQAKNTYCFISSFLLKNFNQVLELSSLIVGRKFY